MESNSENKGVGCFSSLLKRFYQIPCRIICLGVLLLQSCLLDYFLVTYINYYWCLWAIADVVVASLFLASLIISYRLFAFRAHNKTANPEETPGHDKVDTGKDDDKIGGELPLGYIAWFLYALVLSAKIGLIFGDGYYIVQRLDSTSPLGSSVLRTTLSLASIIFFTLVVTHNDAPAKSERQAFMESLSTSVSMDLLDATQFLDVLYPYDSHIMLSYGLHTAVIAFSCITFILPTILLVALSRSRYGRSNVWLKRIKLLHRIFYFLVVNIPMLVIRSVIWHVHKKEASVFIIKNVMGIGVAMHEIHAKVMDIQFPSTPTTDTVEMVPLGPANVTAAEPSVPSDRIESENEVRRR